MQADSMSLKHPVTFGPYVLDPAAQRLWRAGEPVPLAPKVWQLLCHLVAHAPQLVSKEELFRVVWGETIVGELPHEYVGNLKESPQVLNKGVECAAVVIRGTAEFNLDTAVLCDAILEFLYEPGLANPGFAAQQNDLTFAVLGLHPPFLQKTQFYITAH